VKKMNKAQPTKRRVRLPESRNAVENAIALSKTSNRNWDAVHPKAAEAQQGAKCACKR